MNLSSFIFIFNLFYLKNEMFCTKHITFFSLGNSFPLVLVQALYLTKQHNRRAVPSGEDNNRILVVYYNKINEYRYPGWWVRLLTMNTENLWIFPLSIHFLSFPHSWLILVYVTRIARRVPLVKQGLNLSGHPSSYLFIYEFVLLYF